MLMLPSSVFSAENTENTVSTASELVLIEGKVRRFDQENQSLQLQLKGGDKVTVRVDWSTALVGYSSPTEIEKGNKVKIWYHEAGTGSTAVKIEKKLMVGC